MPTPFDLYTTHQVYLEGYKEGEAQTHADMFDEITAVIVLLLNRMGYENMGEIPRKELDRFIAQVNTRVRDIFHREANLTLASLKKFMAVDRTMTLKIMGMLETNMPSTRLDRMWSEAVNAPIPGIGIEPKVILAGVMAAILADTRKSIKIAYASNLTMRDLLASIVGTRAKNYKDGLVNKMRRQFNSAVSSTIQHISSFVTFKLGSLVATQYMWSAILDSRTTDICRSRNGNIYQFKDGPRPPAHYNCRSYIIPLSVPEITEPPTFYSWVKDQPSRVQNDALGAVRGRELREGKLKSTDLPGFDYTRPLTLNQYETRLNQILSEVA